MARFYHFNGFTTHIRNENGKYVNGCFTIKEFEDIIKPTILKIPQIEKVKLEYINSDGIEAIFIEAINEYFSTIEGTRNILNRLYLAREKNQDIKNEATKEKNILKRAFYAIIKNDNTDEQNNIQKEYNVDELEFLNTSSLELGTFDNEFSASELTDFLRNVLISYTKGDNLKVISTNYDKWESPATGQSKLYFNDDIDGEAIIYCNKIVDYSDEKFELLCEEELQELQEANKGIEVPLQYARNNALKKLFDNSDKNILFALKIQPLCVMDALQLKYDFDNRIFADKKSILDLEFIQKFINHILIATPDNFIYTNLHDENLKKLEYKAITALEFLNIFDNDLAFAYELICNICYVFFNPPKDKKKRPDTVLQA